MEKDELNTSDIISLKIKQLRKLGIVNGFLYGSALVFLIAGILKMLIASDWLFLYTMLLGVVLITLALAFLFIHSIKSVSIHQKYLKQ